jgi:hypothetical protein
MMDYQLGLWIYLSLPLSEPFSSLLNLIEISLLPVQLDLFSGNAGDTVPFPFTPGMSYLRRPAPTV